MGVVLWIGSGLLAFAIARIVPPRRYGRGGTESLLATAAALLAGIAATALDFGGWRELDWRAALFAFLLAFTAIGMARLAGGQTGADVSTGRAFSARRRR